jgi:hypothetical protein
MPKQPNLLKVIQELELDPTKQYINFLPANGMMAI